jgi:Skp family chaperone for outer membrane proteins
MKKISIIIFILFFYVEPLKADAYFLDFKFILNQSDAGKKAQNYLKSTLDKGIKDLTDREKKLQGEEKKIIQQKKIISAEEYKKKIADLRIQVTSLQKDRNKLLETISRKRNKARSELLKALNPIVKSYMEEQKIRIVIDKKNILLGDENLDITKSIMTLLNQRLKTIKLD